MAIDYAVENLRPDVAFVFCSACVSELMKNHRISREDFLVYSIKRLKKVNCTSISSSEIDDLMKITDSTSRAMLQRIRSMAAHESQ